MRHTSNSEKRVRSRSNNLSIKSSLINKNRGFNNTLSSREPQNLNKLAASYMNVAESDISPRHLESSPDREIGKIIKRLNKPEMLMCDHL
jgi:hypothetical protein